MTTAAVADAASRVASERSLLEQAFSRAAGGPLVTGNSVRLLRDAAENYPAWLDAIAAAERTIHFETYIIWEDASGARFADALSAKARDGVRVSTEIVLSETRVTDRRRVARSPSPVLRRVGSAGRIAAGALRLGNTASAMLTEHRVLGSAEARAAAGLGGICVAIATIMLLWPRLLTIPLGLIIAWIGAAMLLKAHRLRRERELRGERRKRVVEAAPRADA